MLFRSASLEYPGGEKRVGWWEPWSEKTLTTLQELIQLIGQQYPEAAKHLVGHDEIAIPEGHKCDPGAVFPWERFSRAVPRKLTSTILG